MSEAVLLFDLDGTLTSADHLHHHAFNQIFGLFGVDLSFADYAQSIMGKSNEAIFREFVPHLPPEQQRTLADAKEARFRQLADRLEPLPGLIDLLDFADLHQIRRAVVTNAPRQNADFELAAMGISERFDGVVIAGELVHAKPHPLPYLTGLKLLDGEASTSLAFEDSLSGLSSALAAGLTVVGIATSLPPERLMQAGALFATPDFTDPRIYDFIRRNFAVHQK